MDDPPPPPPGGSSKTIYFTSTSIAFVVGEAVSYDFGITDSISTLIDGAQITVEINGVSYTSGLTAPKTGSLGRITDATLIAGVITPSTVITVTDISGVDDTTVSNYTILNNVAFTIQDAPTGGPCFLAAAPVLTPSGYVKISKLAVGDEVITGEGRTVAIQKVIRSQAVAGPSTNPYIIPKGQFGATQRLLISPNHCVQTAGRLVEARFLGLKQEAMAGSIDYFNLELPASETMVVAGVTVESMAPIRRVTITMKQFAHHILKTYGKVTPAVLANIKRTCRVLENGCVDVPAIRK